MHETDMEPKEVDLESGMMPSLPPEVTLFGISLDGLPSTVQFLVLAGAVIFVYQVYAYMQESLFRLDGFKYGLFMTLFQFAAYVVLSYGKLRGTGRPIRPRAPIVEYASVGLLAVGTLGFSNASLAYLNYPTQVLFKSSKVIPVMIGGMAVLGRRYAAGEYVGAALMVVGLVTCTLADVAMRPNFNLWGVVLISGALLADALIGNFQEKVLRVRKVPPCELVFFSHIIGAVVLFPLVFFTGEWFPAIAFCNEHPPAYAMLLLFAVFSYLGMTTVLTLIKRFGAVLAVMVTSCRKLLTIFLSFVIFPKHLGISYVYGTLIFFCGIGFEFYVKNREECRTILRRGFVYLRK